MVHDSHPGDPVSLAIDAGGGDYGASVFVPAALAALDLRPQLKLCLVGPAADLAREAGHIPRQYSDRLKVEHVDTVLESGVSARGALKAGPGSSVGKAVWMHADGQVDGAVSAGSTTALMALGVKMLGLLPGIRRPALMSKVPSGRGNTVLLDLGANLEADAVQLVQFALMGMAVVAGEKTDPVIGLLNVGHEDSKGHSVVRDAHSRLLEMDIRYAGFIEGNDIFSGKVDIAVCDGFSGNLVLKSSEGLARMLFGALKEALYSSTLARMGAALAGSQLKELVARFDPAKHNGAPLLGLNGVLVKSHGSSKVPATTQAILEACDEAGRQVPHRINKLVETHQAGNGL